MRTNNEIKKKISMKILLIIIKKRKIAKIMKKMKLKIKMKIQYTPKMKILRIIILFILKKLMKRKKSFYSTYILFIIYYNGINIIYNFNSSYTWENFTNI